MSWFHTGTKISEKLKELQEIEVSETININNLGKIRDMLTALNTKIKQGSIISDKHMERIKKLIKKLSKDENAATFELDNLMREIYSTLK